MERRLLDVVHVGFPKTATSFLQWEVLPRLEGVLSFGKGPVVSPEYRRLMDRFASESPFGFSFDFYRSRFRELHELHGVGEEGVRFASHEHLCGELYGGWRLAVLLERLRETFGQIRILLTIREQKTMVESLYRHYVASGGALHIRELLYKRTSPGVDLWGNYELLERFCYDRVIDRCFELFGQENVKVLPFEYVSRCPDRFVEEFSRFLGLDPPRGVDWQALRRNESRSYLGTWTLRWVNQVISTPLSDSPFLRLVPHMHTSLVRNVYEPVDRHLLSRFLRRRRFIDRPKSWRWRRLGKGALEGLRSMAGRRDAPVGGGLRDLVRYLDWPDTNRVSGSQVDVFDSTESALAIRDDIDQRCAGSNRRTMQLTGLPLSDLGYCVAPEDGETDRADASNDAETVRGQ